MLSVMNAHGKDMAVQEQPSSYISNMMLPAKVKATRDHPLGPDCVISNSEITDKDILKRMHYYWCISREKGCVECVIKKIRSQNAVSVSNPKCVITKKHRRFEAFCCMLCRTNFVTIVQALLHLKAIHRPNNKICIQDKDVFANLDKAMEVPPIPLPWHVNKKSADAGKPQDVIGDPPTYVIPPGAFTASSTFNESLPTFVSNNTISNSLSSNNQKTPSQNLVSDSAEKQSSKLKPSLSSEECPDQSPVVSILTAITKKFNKSVKHLQFQKDCTEALVLFVDDTNIVVEIPDLATTTASSSDFLAPDEAESHQLSFYFEEKKETLNGSEVTNNRIILRTDKPRHARSLLARSISATKPQIEKQEKPQKADLDVTPRKSDQRQNRNSSSCEAVPVEDCSDQGKHRTAKPPKKSVRFTLGAPESSDEEISISPDNSGTPLNVQERTVKQEKTKEVPSIEISEIEDQKEPDDVTKEFQKLTKNDVTFDGLQRVIENLITTASKGRIIAPASPVPSNASTSSLPQVGSSPALFAMSTSLPTSGTSSLTRVQSWSPSVTSVPFSVANMRRPYTARGFTYAEKIQFMKQQNDYDAEFVTKHISSAKTSKAEEKLDSGLSSDDAMTSKQQRGRKVRDSEAEDEPTKDGASEAPDPMLTNAAMVAYSALLSRRFLNSAFPSEYYGLGEWASAAMESLKTLQPILRSQEEHSSSRSSPSDVSSPPFSRKSTDVRRHSRSGRPSESLSDDNSAKLLMKSKSSFPRKRCKSHSELSSHVDEECVSKRTKLAQNGPKPDPRPSDYLDTSPSLSRTPTNDVPQSDVRGMTQHDPLKSKRLSQSLDVDKVLKPELKVSSSSPVKESSKQPPHVNQTPHTVNPDVKLKNPSVSNLSSKSMLAKCSSDSALSSSAAPDQCDVVNHSSSRTSFENDVKTTTNSATTERSKPKDVVLLAEEKLELIKNVSLSDFQRHHVIITRLTNDNKRSNENSQVLTNMPAMFNNCIETYVQIQCVKKVSVCKVCGFSVDVTSDATSRDERNPAASLEAHVMEHSLKELYATNCETKKQW